MLNESAIFSFPPEILTHCLALSTPEACAAFAQICRAAYAHSQSNALWRGLHRVKWDDPPPSTNLGSPQRYSYEAAVKDRRRAANRLEKSNRSRQALPDRECVPVVRALVQTALERPWGGGPSRNEDWLADLLRASPEDEDGAEGILSLAAGYGPRSSSGHFLRSRPNATTFNDSTMGRGYLTAVPPEVDEATAPDSIVAGRLAELVARLHLLATPSPLAFENPSIRTRAKELVYTRANWTRHACYGPFQSDGSGRVDWRKVEALAIVAGANFSDARVMGWGRPPRPRRNGRMEQQGADSDTGPAVPPRGWSSSRPLSAGPVRLDPEGRDWSGLTSHELVGSYMFLHYPMYIAFQLGTSSLSLEDEDEAVGDCLPMVFELLPEGEWPAEVEQPDLSFEAQNLADEDDEEDDRDWTDGSVSDSDHDDDDDDDDDSVLEDDIAGNLSRPDHLAHSIASLLSAGSSSQSLRQGPVHNEYQPAVPISRSGSSNIPMNRAVPATQGELDHLFPALHAPAGSPSATSPSPRTDFLTHVPLHGVHAPGRSPPPQTEVGHPPPPPSLPSTRLRPPPDSVPHPTHPTLAFRGVPGSLRYAEPDAIPALRPVIEDLYHPEARTFRGTIEWLPDDQAAKVTLVVRYGGEDQWVMTGVQFGGPGSRTGFVGVWTSADHSPESPTGPFMYWPHIRPEVGVNASSPLLVLRSHV